MRRVSPPSHIHRETTRHGQVKWFYRVGHGPRTRLTAPYGTAEFWAEVEAARKGEAPPTATPAAARLSLAWCIAQFMASRAWAVMAPESRKQMSYQFEKIRDNAGTADIRQIRRKHILDARDRRAHVPSDANKYVRAMTLLCRHAVEQEWIAASPVMAIGKLKTGEGFYTWTTEDFAAFEARWPLGSFERLAYEIFINTGLRRGDVRKFGRQHMRGRIYHIATAKTGRIVSSTITPRLAEAIAKTPCGEMTLILTSHGVPFQSAAGFGGWFGAACKAAGITGNAHGIRKGLACMLAEKGLSEAQLNAFFGWSHGSGESAVYIEKAHRAKMAKQGTNIISRTFKKSAGK